MRELLAGEDDLALTGDFGGYVDRSALRQRYKRALHQWLVSSSCGR